MIVSGSKFDKSESEDISFYSPQKGIYVVDVNTKSCVNCIEPYISDSLETVESVAENSGAAAAINAGFFDPSNAKTTSYIVKNSELAADPALNEKLMNNPELNKYLSDILNRSEFRKLSCNDGFRYEIAQHQSNPSDGCSIIHSIQAGPELVPSLKLKEEAFVIKKDEKVIRQSAGALGKYARSAVGIKGQHILFVAVSNESPMTLAELAEFMKNLDVTQAMAFDGGSSTSLYVNLPDYQKFVLTSAKNNAARQVKSVILIKFEK